jgi:formate-dependent nitrite reductase membrane component NrfD
MTQVSETGTQVAPNPKCKLFGEAKSSPKRSHSPKVGSAADNRIAVLNPLRGVAALGVMWFHFTRPSELLPPQTHSFYDMVTVSGSWGWMGVKIFFVISGFILPYSMFHARYQIRNFFHSFLNAFCDSIHPTLQPSL